VKGFNAVRRSWTSHAWGLDQRLIARLPDGEVEGTCLGIDANGSLQMKLAGGKKHLVHAGDVFPVEAVCS
jgi:BirA family biotin operon repressor/biotin-[acetyl-CoA-carboxylase] ligase